MQHIPDRAVLPENDIVLQENRIFDEIEPDGIRCEGMEN